MPTTTDTDPEPSTLTLPLYAEALVVARRRTHSTVRVATVTHKHEQLVDEALTHERVEVEHVPIGRTVEAVPPVREEGDTTILSVVEEVVVVERRLVLKEEIRIRRLRSTEQHRETVLLRTQETAITAPRRGRNRLAMSASRSGLSAIQPGSRTCDRRSHRRHV